MIPRVSINAAMRSSKQLTQVKRQALEALRPYSTDRGMNFPGEVLIVSGAKRALI